MQLVGYPYSPFVRKVALALNYKNIAFERNPLDPFNHKDEILKLNPSGKVPVLLVDEFAISESDRIVQWIDEQHPDNHLIPLDSHLRERVMLASSWADQSCAPTLGGKLFFQRVLKPHYANEPGDQQMIDSVLSTAGPALLAALEQQSPKEDFIVGEFSLADITLSSWLRAGLLAGLAISASDYPKLVAYLSRVYQSPTWRTEIQFENTLPLVQQAREQFAVSQELLK